MGSEVSGWFVTANDIRKWTETKKRQSEEILPLLVQKLILASCKPSCERPPVERSDFEGLW